MVFEAKIPVALDPRGVTVNIDEALENPRYYRCIECKDYLQVRHGDIRAWYFAHYPQNKESPACTLRTIGGIQKLLEELRISPIEKSENNHSLRIAIIPDYYIKTVRVVAIIQNPISELIGNMEEALNIADSISITGDGLLKKVDSRLFRPSRPIVFLDLDPNATNFRLEFESTPQLKAFNGQWISKGISDGDVFAGSNGILERIENYKKVSENDTYYEIQLNLPEDTKRPTLKVGSKFAIEREIGELIIKSEGTEKESKLSLKTFEVDVVEPQLSDPWGRDIIYGSPNSEALLTIRPLKGLDPVFEIVSVPKTVDSIVEIKPTGPGKIRYHRIKFPEVGSRRITIHHADSHVYLHFFSIKEDTGNIDLDLGKYSVGIYYPSNERKIERMYPWENKIIRIQRKSVPEIRIFQQENLSIELRIRAFREGHKLFANQLIGDLGLTYLMETLMYEGAKSFRITFEGFGSIDIELIERPKKMSTEEIAERIKKFGFDNKTKVTWGMLRRLCEIAPGTPHKEVSQIITPKAVRKALKLLKEGDGGHH
ncbi:MAG: competence protein CoiA family protein [Leptospirales bacterium]